MTKTLFTLFLALLAVFPATAQQYEVYRHRGEANLVVKQKPTPITKGQVLTPKDIVSLAHRSELKMIERETQEMITLKGQCVGSLATLIDQQQNARQKMTPDYFNFVVSNLKGEGYDEGLQAGRSTTIYRDDSDSLFASPSVDLLPDSERIHLPVLIRSTDLMPVPALRMTTAPALKLSQHVKERLSHGSLTN